MPGFMKSVFLILCVMLAVTPAPVATSAPAFGAPVLKWQYGGCSAPPYNYCDMGWYSSPAVADLDGNGQVEVISTGYTIYALNGATGAVEWKVTSGHDRAEPGASNVGRTWPGVALGDVDGDGQIEIVTAHGGGWVSVYTAAGYFEPGWPQRPVTNELRGLALADLDLDGTLEAIVTAAVGSQTNTWVYEHNGTLRPGWPQVIDDSAYAWGVYNANLAIGPLVGGDSQPEIVVPSDVHYIALYRGDGSQPLANSMYVDDDGVKTWGRVGVWESIIPEERGWGRCDGTRVESYRTNFAHGPAAIADVDGNGTMEVVATGNVYDCYGSYDSRYTGVYIFNPDRTRFVAGGYDWQAPPVDTGAPLSEDYDIIQNAQSNPVVVDLDGDGVKEILFASYDGQLHAFWLDKTEHGSWPYAVYDPGEGVYRFASEPAVADLDNDGQAEVIFTSWPANASGQVGKLHILNSQGVLVYEVALPNPSMGATFNGSMAAPTLANIDADVDLEVVLTTIHSGAVAYDLPGTAGARILWGTGRGNYWRNGYVLPPRGEVTNWVYLPTIQR